jgi:subtilisin family serine protease
MAPKADLVMVKTNFQTTGVLDGVKYCFDLATARGQSAVVNLSLGSYFGPHDGTSDFEAGLSALTGPGRIVVKSAGNGRGTARHAEAIGAANVTTSVTGSDVGGMVAIDGYYESTENLSVKVTTPDGAVVGPIARGAAAGPYPGPPTPSGEVYLENGLSVTSTGDFEVYIEINVEAGQDMDGTWTITFTPVALGPAHGEVDLWRFATTSGSVVADFVVGNQPTEELITEPGNAVELITVAAWVSKDRWIDCNGSTTGFQTGSPGNLAPFSSPGPTRDGRQKPDIAAPGTAIGSSTSFDIPQSCSPGGSTLLPDGLSHVMSQGTSMAAPHVAGAAAILMQRYGAMTPSQLKSFLATHAKTDGFTGPVWNKDWGYGKLFIDFRPIAAAGGWPLTAFSLSPIAPNPARGPVHIDYAVTGEARVRLSVLDVRGREVARLANGVHRPGRYRVTWSGERAGEMAPAGLYFVCLKVPEGALVRRVVIAR